MSMYNGVSDRDETGRLKRNLRRPRYPLSTPGWWVRMHMNRPRRHLNRSLCRQVEKGRDPESIAWPLGNHKPHLYYW